MKIPTPDEDLDEIMSRAAGRRFIREMLRSVHEADGFSSDPLSLAYQAGIRSVARSLDHRVKQVCAQKWLMMMSEEIAALEDRDREVPHDEP